MNDAINFYGIAADKVGAKDFEPYGLGWTRSDFEWRASWHRSEYHALRRYERAQYVALVLGTITGVLWPTALVYLLKWDLFGAALAYVVTG